MSEQGTTLVVPCFNEGTRLDGEQFLTLLAGDRPIQLLFVDDGSQDNTLALLHALQAKGGSAVRVLPLEQNQGKAEAVRSGLLQALTDGAPVVGYVDADLATPIEEVRRLVDVMATRDADVVVGARVALMGREIDRSPMRHYLGRIFASAASLVLQRSVYDTQCGAKLFRRTSALENALADPFVSRWAFDVELLGRLMIGGPAIPGIAPLRIIEEPLRRWKDVPGSKLRPIHMARAAADLARIRADLTRRRAAAR
jgi:glycosyltransferase involved in cell wall biosynthesis